MPSDSDLRCSKQIADTARGVRYAYKFESGEPPYGDQRSISVSYDSAGQVSDISQLADTYDAKVGSMADGMFAVFVSHRSFGMYTHQVQHPDVASGDTTFMRRPMTAEEIQQARALAEWLWRQRCDGS